MLPEVKTLLQKSNFFKILPRMFYCYTISSHGTAHCPFSQSLTTFLGMSFFGLDLLELRFVFVGNNFCGSHRFHYWESNEIYRKLFKNLHSLPKIKFGKFGKFWVLNEIPDNRCCYHSHNCLIIKRHRLHCTTHLPTNHLELCNWLSLCSDVTYFEIYFTGLLVTANLCENNRLYYHNSVWQAVCWYEGAPNIC